MLINTKLKWKGLNKKQKFRLLSKYIFCINFKLNERKRQKQDMAFLNALKFFCKNHTFIDNYGCVNIGNIQ